MEVERVFHMNSGNGTTSYANNSLLQRAIISWAKPIVDASVHKLCCTRLPAAECLRIADLGCSSGPNTLSVVSNIIDTIQKTCQDLNHRSPSLQVFLNDLPHNDFNTVFQSLPDFYKNLNERKWSEPCFIAGIPGSFYGRLFPNNSIDFFHSSNSLHWISKVPIKGLNEGNICIAKTSPSSVFNEYFEQFNKDFTMFLRCRAEELVPQGRMVLVVRGSINSHEPLTEFEHLGLKINDMVLEGLIEKEKLDSFNLPFYEPTMKELMELIEAEGSFKLQDLQHRKHDWDSTIKEADHGLDKEIRGAIFSNHIRSALEPFLASHFGDGIIEDLFCRYGKDVLDYIEKEKCPSLDLVISLTKDN